MPLCLRNGFVDPSECNSPRSWSDAHRSQCFPQRFDLRVSFVVEIEMSVHTCMPFPQANLVKYLYPHPECEMQDSTVSCHSAAAHARSTKYVRSSKHT